MSVPPSSSLGEHITMRVGREKRVSKAQHAVRRTSAPCYSTQTDSGFQSSLFAKSQKARFVLEAGSTYRIRSIVLKITVSVSGGAARLAPVPLWFDHIDTRANGGSSLLNTLYGDQIYHALSTIPQDRLPAVLRACNMDEDWDALGEIPSGATRTFYLPLIGHPFAAGAQGLFWNGVRSDCHFELFSQPAKISGAGTVTCDDISFVLSSQTNVSPIDLQTSARLMSSTMSARHIEFQPQIFTNVNIQAAKKTQLRLDGINGNAAWLSVLIRDTGASNTDDGLRNTKSLRGGTLDLETSSGQSIYGDGTAVDVDFIQAFVNPSHYANNFPDKHNWYQINLTDSTRGAYAGSMGSGFLSFGGSSAAPMVAITPGAAAVDAVDTLTIDSGGSTGSYVLSYKGFDTTTIASGALPSTIKAALEALPSMKDADGQPITVTVSAAFNAGANPTITYEADADIGNQSVLFRELDGARTATTARTTDQVVGWHATSGNTYEVVVYAAVFRDLLVKSGSLNALDA